MTDAVGTRPQIVRDINRIAKECRDLGVNRFALDDACKDATAHIGDAEERQAAMVRHARALLWEKRYGEGRR